MPLESATYISGLVATNPVGATDPKSQGDDHLRLIKSALLNTFPNVTGAITASHTELNYLDGLTGVTGTGNLVASAAPTLTGAAAYGSLAGGAVTMSGGALNITYTGSHISLFESDAADPLDKALIEVNSGSFNIYGYDDSTATFLQLLGGNILSGVCRFGVAGANNTLYGNVIIPGTCAITGATTVGGNAVLTTASAVTEAQITDSTILTRNAGTETISGAWTFSSRPKFTSAGGFISHASASNLGGKITLSDTEPASAAAIGSAGDMVFEY